MRKFLFVTTLTVLPLSASADSRMPPISNELVKKECGACHMPFLPVFLPQRSWRALMSNLSDHFGESAMITNEGDRREILGYLAGGAADVSLSKSGIKMLRGIAQNETPLRITELPRWRRKHSWGQDDDDDHDRNKSSVRSAPIKKVDCVACHPRANHGDYDDD